MSLKSEILTFIKSKSEVTDIVGNRIWYDKLPEDATLPAITFSRISDPHKYTQSGDSGHRNPRVQFSCWAETDQAAEDLGETLSGVMTAFVGAFGSINIQSSMIENKVDMHDPATKRYFVPVDIKFRYNG